MNKIFTLLVAFATIVVFTACEDYLIPQDSPSKKGITFTNTGNVQGMYVIVGEPALREETQNGWLPPRQGEYKAYFSSVPPQGDVISISGKDPIIIGQAAFTVSDTGSKTTISVPVKQISSKLFVQKGKNIRMSKVLLKGLQPSVLMNGQFDGAPKSIQFDKIDYSFYWHIVATQIEISVSVDILNNLGETQDIKTFKGKIDIQAGHQYTVTVDANGLSVSE
jgi:hypothetical protein